MDAMEIEKEDLSIFAQSSRFRIVTAERYATSLWEAIVMLGGFWRREGGDMPYEEKQELLTREEENKLDWEAGRTRVTRERRELTESSSPNRYDTPRSARGVWAEENAANEEEEEGGNDEESEDVMYGPPTTEEEPEPHDVRNESPMVEPEVEERREDDDEHGLRTRARRLTALLRHEEALLEMAYSQGEFEDAERIEANIEHLEGLRLHLPRP